MQAFLLAGGHSRRMGRDKARLELAGQPLVAQMLAKVASLGLRASICGNRPDLAALAPVLPDPALQGEESQGPLAGILAALEASNAPLNLFLAVDLPAIPVEFLHWIIDRAEHTQAAATIPLVSGRPQPLCAVYHRDLAPEIRRSLEAGERRVFPVLRKAALSLDLLNVECMVSSGLIGPTPAVPPHLWFHNLNTPQDVALYAARHPSNKL